MGDLISRQAAIDAMTNTLWHYPNECYRNLNVYEFAKGLAEIGLKSVPSAQPDGIPLEWIKKHLEWLDNCDNDFSQLAKVSIRAMVELWKKDRI